MHYNSLYSFNNFVKEFLYPYRNKKLRILDVGSMSVNGASTYKRYINDPLWEYVGLDIAHGDNVDVVVDDLYKYPFEDNSFDVVVSGSTMEHVEDIYAWIKELARITNNLVWINIPNTCKEHKHPVDCWRIFPDGMRFLLGNVAGLEVIRSEKSKHDKKDTIGIAKKY